VGKLSLGKVIAFMSFYGYLFSSLSELVGINVEFQRSLASIKRIFSLLSHPPEEAPEKSAAGGRSAFAALDRAEAITFANVYFSYNRKEINLINLSLEIPRGQMFGLIGKSGSGKSTIVKLLAGFYSPKKGKVSIGSTCIADIPLNVLRKKVGIIAHDPIMFSATIGENITLGNHSYTRDDISRVCKVAMAHEFIYGFPLGLDTAAGENGVNLSIGERQRISIARTLLKNPEILILDEGTSGIDAAAEKKILDQLTALYKDRFLIMITHRFFSLQNAETIAVLDNGMIKGIGTPEEIYKNDVFRDLFDKQVIEIYDTGSAAIAAPAALALAETLSA